jgi:hypothetical protein
MTRRRNGPLATMSDAEVLRLAARHFDRQAQRLRDLAQAAGGGDMGTRDRVEYAVLTDSATRFRALARRVPLWTERKS